ncbi:kinase-like domain-containing protein [Russula emetica]|nr:kinase-like domain-containing protein [Russula emetica]
MAYENYNPYHWKRHNRGAVPQVVPSPRSKAADHSGKVTRVSEHPVIEGSQLLIYIGEWTSDGERTALGRLRYQTPDSQKRFKEWIEASLGFQHRNILNVAGHVTINDVVYSVNPNPWIENGNIREYLRRNPDADRVRLLSEVASGVEFFHEREILHGDLCGKNILINHDGKAIVCGFGLSEFSNPGVSRARWLAPEQITSASAAAPTEKADIWSFGLLCLEVFTGEDPYHGHSDLYVPVLLSQGTHPEHPGSMAVGLSPKMWDLMQSCWQVDPAQRPSMSEIQSTIRDMLLRRDEQPFQPFQPFCIYQEQLSSIYHGLALWKPNPVLYDRVSIGDVGYVNNEGAFIRLFNVTLPWDDESNKTLALGDPLYYDPLRPDSFTIRSETFGKSDHYSRRVSREDNAHSILAKTPDQAEGVTYECRGHGALLSLPCGGLRQAVIQTKIFEEYAGEHVADWFRWSKPRSMT